jgi:molybdate transport system substrate-binding protein
MPITITSIAGGAPKPVFDRLCPLFEQRTGHRVNALYATMSGIADRVCAGDSLDVLVMPVPLIEAYVQDDTVLPGGRMKLAKIGLAVGVQAGTKAPDVSTRDALRAALLAARSVVHAPPSATPSGAQSDGIIKELGLGEALAGRLVHKAGLAGGLAMIASGEADLGIFPKSEIVNSPGVVSAGSPPKDLDLHAVYAAGVKATTKVPGPAAEFIAFLTEPDSRKVWLACGFDPLGS